MVCDYTAITYSVVFLTTKLFAAGMDGFASFFYVQFRRDVADSTLKVLETRGFKMHSEVM